MADFTVLRCRGIRLESGLAFAALHELLWPAAERISMFPEPQAKALNGARGAKTRSPHRPGLLAWATSESPGTECSRVRLTIQQRELASGVRGGDVFEHPLLSFLRLISDQELGVLELQAVLE